MGNDARDFLMGQGVPWAKFERIGDIISGRIVTDPKVSQQTEMGTGKPLFWDDGNPKMQLLVDVQTDGRDPSLDHDDGTRRLYVKGAMQYAIRDAVKAAGADEVLRGGTITVQYTHDGDKRAGFNAPKQYTAKYSPPSATGDFLGTAAQTFQAHAPASVNFPPKAADPRNTYGAGGSIATATGPTYPPKVDTSMPTGNGNGNGGSVSWALDPVQEAALRNANIDVAGLLIKRQALAEAGLDPNLATP